MMGMLHESYVKAIEEFSPGMLVIGYKSHAFRPSSSVRLIKSLTIFRDYSSAAQRQSVFHLFLMLFGGFLYLVYAGVLIFR